MQQVIIGRNTGQWFRVRSADGTEFFVRAEKCCNGYVRLSVECADSFEVHRWDIENGATEPHTSYAKQRSREIL